MGPTSSTAHWFVGAVVGVGSEIGLLSSCAVFDNDGWAISDLRTSLISPLVASCCSVFVAVWGMFALSKKLRLAAAASWVVDGPRTFHPLGVFQEGLVGTWTWVVARIPFCVDESV